MILPVRRFNCIKTLLTRSVENKRKIRDQRFIFIYVNRKTFLKFCFCLPTDILCLKKAFRSLHSTTTFREPSSVISQCVRSWLSSNHYANMQITSHAVCVEGQTDPTRRFFIKGDFSRFLIDFSRELKR